MLHSISSVTSISSYPTDAYQRNVCRFVCVPETECKEEKKKLKQKTHFNNSNTNTTNSDIQKNAVFTGMASNNVPKNLKRPCW